jgi:hypothetical protein
MDTGNARPAWMDSIWLRYWRPVLVILAATMAYAGTCRLGFASDDVSLVDRLITDGWAGIAPFLSPATGATGSGGYSAYYRPMWALLTAMDFAIWGTNSTGYHLTNVLLFIISTALVWDLVFRVTSDRDSAFWAGLLFAVHPIHTMNAIWISGRTDLIATFGVLASIDALIRWRQTGSPGWMFGSIAAAFVGLGGKEMAYTLPALAVATEWTRLSVASGSRPFRDALRASIPVWSAVAMWAGFVMASSSFASSFYWGISLRHAAVNWGAAVALLILPFGYDTLAFTMLAHPVILATCAVAVLLAALAVLWFLRRNRAAVWGLLWIAVAIMPLYRLTMRWYLFLPSVGFCIVAGVTIAWIIREADGWKRFVPGVVVIALIFTGLVIERVKWVRADALGRSTLESMADLATRSPRPDRLIFTSVPSKCDGIPVFGGNTESFLRVEYARRGLDPRSIPDVRVLAHVAIRDAGVSPHVVWASSRRLSVSLRPGEGEIILPGQYLVTARRRAFRPGDDAPTEYGPARVLAVAGSGKPCALDITADEPGGLTERWGNLRQGLFVHVMRPETDAVKTTESE